MRVCHLRRRRRTDASAAVDGAGMRRALLDLTIATHPLPLGFDGAASALLADPGDLAEAFAFAQAVRDLVLAGLLASDGLRVYPTRAALTFARLEAAR